MRKKKVINEGLNHNDKQILMTHLMTSGVK